MTLLHTVPPGAPAKSPAGFSCSARVATALALTEIVPKPNSLARNADALVCTFTLRSFGWLASHAGSWESQ
jgi:hypothetical protein